jgi:hypothetical protein
MPAPIDAVKTGRIGVEALARAVREVTALDLNGRLALCDDIAAAQPNLLAAILATTQLRPGAVAGDLLLEILMVCFRAMSLSGHRWALISEADQAQQLTRLTGQVRFAAGSPGGLQQLAEQAFVADHPESLLLAYVLKEVTTWLQRPEVHDAALEQDKYLILAAFNTVQCIAYGSVLPPE